MLSLTLTQFRVRKLLEAPGDPSERVKVARQSFRAFVEHITGHAPAHHHLQWCDLLQTDQDSSALKKIAGDHSRIAAPRDSAKTTYMTAFIAWVIGHNSNARIIVTSYNLEIAQAISVYARNLVESPRYKEVFPWINPSSKWSERQWTVQRQNYLKDPTVLAVGMSGGLASRRADLVIIDDPIKSSLDIAAKETRESMRLWYSEVLRPCVVPGGRILVACTRYRIDDIHGTTFTESNGWKVLTQPAIVTDFDGKPRSYWPSRYPLDLLEKRREENPVAFASQYQNDPLPAGNSAIRPEWITVAPITGHYRFLTLGIDPAISKRDSADYSALVLVGVTKSGKLETIFSRQGRWSLRELLSQVFSIADEWEDTSFRIAIETVAYQAAIAQELQRTIYQTDRDIRVKEIKPRGDKESRLYGVAGVLESGDHSFAPSQCSELIEQLLAFGSLPHDDLADAWVYAIRESIRGRELQTKGLY